MDILKIKGAQLDNVGQAQGYLPLPVRWGVGTFTMTDGSPYEATTMETLWQPDENERKAIAAGVPIKVCILGTQHPPIMLRLADANDIDFVTNPMTKLDILVANAKARWEKMTLDQQEEELKAQRASWVRGEKGMGSDRDEASYRDHQKDGQS